MTQYDNNGSGALFINEKRKGRQPHLRGFMNVAGVDHWMSCWKKVSKETGKPYLSMVLQEKEVEDAPNIEAELHPIENPKSEKAPTMGGTINIGDEGDEVAIVAWVRTKSSDGKPFYSIKVDEQEEKESGDEMDDTDFFFGVAETPEPETEEPEVDQDEEEEIPF